MNGADTVDSRFGSCFYYSRYGVACYNMSHRMEG